ncbi:MAG: hypothetical protein K6B45_00170 [Bacteroidaceae bacterium]|nr:hypothetical protein [Bacteroidaceae bacterium]
MLCGFLFDPSQERRVSTPTLTVFHPHILIANPIGNSIKRRVRRIKRYDNRIKRWQIRIKRWQIKIKRWQIRIKRWQIRIKGYTPCR